MRIGTPQGGVSEPLEGVPEVATLRDGVLRVSPLVAQVSRGRLEAYATLDATVEPPTVDALISLVNLRLEQVAQEIEKERFVEHIGGGLGGSAELSAAGRTPREMIGRLNGTLGLAMNRGSTSYVADRLAALDLAGVAKWLAGEDEPIELECMLSIFEVQDGVARARVMLLASEDTDFWGEGAGNLGEGTVELELEAQPRDPRLGALAAPIAALLGTVTTGPGDDTVCHEYAPALESIEEGSLPDIPVR